MKQQLHKQKKNNANADGEELSVSSPENSPRSLSTAAVVVDTVVASENPNSNATVGDVEQSEKQDQQQQKPEETTEEVEATPPTSTSARTHSTCCFSIAICRAFCATPPRDLIFAPPIRIESRIAQCAPTVAKAARALEVERIDAEE